MYVCLDPEKNVTVDARRRELGRSERKTAGTMLFQVVPSGNSGLNIVETDMRSGHRGFQSCITNAADIRYIMERVQADLHLPRGRPERAAAGKR
jgi:hypothetical protein